MMRPVSVVLPPRQPDGVTITLVSVAKNGKTGTVNVAWNDNSIADTAYVVQRKNGTGTWVDLTTLQIPLDQPNRTGAMSYDDTTWTPTGAYQYRVVARNVVGYGGGMPAMSAQSISAAVPGPIKAPTGLSATLLAGPQVRLNWTDNALNETGFTIERRDANGGTFAQVGTAPARTSTGAATFTDTSVQLGTTYEYRVAATNAAGQSDWSNTVSVRVDVPPAPTITSATAARAGGGERITVTWGTVASATGYRIQWSADQAFTTVAGTATVGTVTTFTTPTLARQTWYVRVIATNPVGPSPPSAVSTVPAA